MDVRYKKLGKNSLLVLLGQAGSSLVSLLMLPLYTHWLSTEEYGAVDLMTTYASILLSVVTCCLADAIFIFPKGADVENRRRYFTSGLVFVLFTTTIVLLLNALLTGIYDNGNFLKFYSWHTVFLTIGMFLQQYVQQFARSLEKMTVFSTTGIVYTLCVASLSVLLIPIYHLEGYVLSLILSNFIAAIYSFIFSKSRLYISINAFSMSHLKLLVAYGIPLIPNSIMWWMVNGLNRPVIESYLGLSAIGLYAVASKFPGVISMLAGVFSNAWGISMLDEFGKSGFENFFNKSFAIVTLVSVIASFFMIVFSKEIIILFSSEAFYEAWHVLPLLVVGTVLNTSTGLVGGIFMAIKKSKYFFYSSAISAIVSLVFTFILIRWFGLIGCALAVALSFLAGLLTRLIFAWKYIKGFNIMKYMISILVLLIAYYVVEQNFMILIKYIIFVSLFMVIIVLNRDVLLSVKKVIIKK